MVSIIIAVYNAQKFLEQCVQSVLNQTYKDIEVLLINDGSTDNSANICEEFAKKDSRVRVIHKNNEGESATRNLGVKEARGEYITFVDNDDYVAPDFVESMLSLMQEKQADICICSFVYVDEEENELSWYTPRLEQGRCMTALELEKRYLSSYDIEGFPWNKLVRRELYINHGIQYEGSYPADMGASFELIRCCNKAVLCNKRLYFYRQNDMSAIHTMSIRKIEGMNQAICQIRDKGKADGMDEYSERFYVHHMTHELYNMWKMKGQFESEWKNVIDVYRKESYWNIPLSRRLVMICQSEFPDRAKIAIKLLIMTFKGVFR